MDDRRSNPLLQAQTALRTLFFDFIHSVPGETEQFFQSTELPVAGTLHRVLSTTAEYLQRSGGDLSGCTPLTESINALVMLSPKRPLIELLEDEFFELLIHRQLNIADWLKPNTSAYSQLEFYRQNFLVLAEGVNVLWEICQTQAGFNPALKGCLGGSTVLNGAPADIVAVAAWRDPFAASRIYRYNNGKFAPVQLDYVRDPDKFYGFTGVRSNFREHLSDFAAGKTNVPLMVSSLPGLGKTQFSMAYILEHPEITLILAEPETLSEDLEKLIGDLSLRRHRKFAVFFDDIEPDQINWYSFRTNVGGSGTLPGNIIFVMASNYPFPVNILSRGREITFPVFDELRCMEMVKDFLLQFGLKQANENLASVIASSYIEDFGQKKFTELSPRTLVRYLGNFRKDAALRKRMMTMSQQEMIVRPDAQIFYEFNIKSLRALYGESYIDALREERLKSLGGN